MIAIQVKAVKHSITKTAAEPMSLALPESSWYSSPMRSTTASIAEFNNSTVKVSQGMITKSKNSTALSAKTKARMVNTIESASSWRSAASFLRPAYYTYLH